MGLHREIKSNLPEGFAVGQKTIPAGQQIHKGFYPKEDLPSFASLNYFNGRETPERQKKPKNERGYYNNRLKLKKKR